MEVLTIVGNSEGPVVKLLVNVTVRQLCKKLNNYRISQLGILSLFNYIKSMVAVEEQETEDLKSFRESWKREVHEKQRLHQDSGRPTTPKQASASETRVRHLRPLQSRDDALEVYIRAVTHEQAGELDEALRLYRQAFHMNPDVDRVHYLGEQRAAQALEASAVAATSVGPEIEMKTVEAFGPGGVTRGVAHTHRKLASSATHHPDRHVSGILARIVADFPEALSFEPEDEKAPSFLQWLPDELLVHILRYLGTTAIERFACVSRRARVITLDTAIWRSGFPLTVNPLCH
jgi:F-box protein 9